MHYPDLVEEFKRNPELKEEDLQHLREWNKKEVHLPSVPDFLLIKFLHKCHFSLEKAKRAIDNCFTVRTFCTEIYHLLDPLKPEIQTVRKYVESGYLPKCDPDGCKILMIRICPDDPSLFIFEHFIAWWDFQLGVLFTEPTMPGLRIIFDTKGLPLAFISKLNFMLLSKVMFYVQRGLCIRLASLHFINVGPILDKLLIFLKPLMTTKSQKKLHFHSTLKDLYKMVPQDLLPSEYGGKGGSLKMLSDDLNKRIVANRDWHEEFRNMTVDESRRHKTSIDFNNVFGVNGSFRKLNID